jgi:ankyrin repeat protein
VDAEDTQQGWSPLCTAASVGNARVCDALLRRGAAVDRPCRALLGEPAMHVACERGHVEVVRLLLANGAVVDNVNASGFTPLMVAAQEGQRAVAALLLSHGAAVNSVPAAASTPLSVACQHGRREVVHLLLARGVDVAQRCGPHGGFALHVACHSGHQDLVDLLLAHGADSDGAASNGATPLYAASEGGHTQLAALLLSRGARVDARGLNGQTPLMAACHGAHFGVAALLLSKGGPRPAGRAAPGGRAHACLYKHKEDTRAAAHKREAGGAFSGCQSLPPRPI